MVSYLVTRLTERYPLNHSTRKKRPEREIWRHSVRSSRQQGGRAYKANRTSALRDLLTNVLEAVVESSPSYSKFSEDFEVFAEGIKTEKSGDGRSLTGLESDLSRLLESWGTDLSST